MLRKIPPRRQQVYDFIRSEVAAGRGFPSAKAIAKHMGWKHASSADDALHGLRVNGVVKMVGSRPFKWELRE